MTRNTYFVAALGLAMLFSAAAPAYASSLSSTQVSSIVSLLQSFGVDQQTVVNVEAALGVTTPSPTPLPTPIFPPPPPPCTIHLLGDEGMGSSGTDVTALQQALGVSATGYFGSLTTSAVTKWQHEHSLPETGYVGALTRAALFHWCPTPPPGSSEPTLYSVNPSSGSVGTAVTLMGSGFTSDNTILFDGNVAAAHVPVSSSREIACTTDPNCHGGLQQTLQFNVPSTLSANCPPGGACTMNEQEVTPATYTVTVQNVDGTSDALSFAVTGTTTPPQSTTFTGTPTSGTAPLSVFFSATGLSGSSYIINYGDGQNSGPLNTVEPPCVPNATQCGPMIDNTHTYSSAGTYTATLSPYVACLYSTPACLVPIQILGSVTISVSGQSTGSLSISGLDAPSQLAVGQTGTWTVHVNNATGQLSYSVLWGDEGYGVANALPATTMVNTSGTFTHAYMNSGTYRPIFTVSGTNGSANTSATVVVGGAPSPFPPPCIEMKSDIGFGSSGSAVTQLQQSLGVSPTGYFGPETKSAVTTWQTAHNVAATGYVGPLTRDAFIIGCGNPPPPVSTGSQPILYAIGPASGSVGTTVTLTGFGFTSDNTILFDGNLAVRNAGIISSIAIACTTNPTCHPGIQETLQFAVPSTLGPDCPVGSLCPTYVRSVTPGAYQVSVENTGGKSNTFTFTVTSQ